MTTASVTPVSRIEELQVGFETAHGSGDVRGVAAGFKFNLTVLLAPMTMTIILVVSTITHAESEGFLSDGGADGDGGFRVQLHRHPRQHAFSSGAADAKADHSGRADRCGDRAEG